jgi:hypothetical protein
VNMAIFFTLIKAFSEGGDEFSEIIKFGALALKDLYVCDSVLLI